jgi:hypothetical protein
LYLYTRSEGRPQATYIPKARHQTVRTWVNNGRRLKRLIDQVSQHNLQALLKEKEPLLTRKGQAPSEDPAP